MNKVLELFQKLIYQVAIGPRLFKGWNGMTYFPTPRGFFTSRKDCWPYNVWTSVLQWKEEFAYQLRDPTPKEIAEYYRRGEAGASHIPPAQVEVNLLTGARKYLGFGVRVKYRWEFVGSIANAAVEHRIFDQARAVATQLIDDRRQGSRLWTAKEPFLEGTLKVALLKTNML